MIKYLIFLLQRPRICAIIEILERMMHMTKMTIDRVKRSLQPFVGCEIELDVNIGRNRVVNHKGELEALLRKEDAALDGGFTLAPANLEQIMVHLEREAEV